MPQTSRSLRKQEMRLKYGTRQRRLFKMVAISCVTSGYGKRIRRTKVMTTHHSDRERRFVVEYSGKPLTMWRRIDRQLVRSHDRFCSFLHCPHDNQNRVAVERSPAIVRWSRHNQFVYKVRLVRTMTFKGVSRNILHWSKGAESINPRYLDGNYSAYRGTFIDYLRTRGSLACAF